MVQHTNEKISEANVSHQSKSIISGGQDCESESTVKRHGSSFDYKPNPKCQEADDLQNVDSVGSTRQDSMKTRENCSIYGEGDLNVWRHDSLHGTESSCSNSLPVVPPVSMSNKSHQETFREAYSLRNSDRPLDSCNSKSVERRSEEPALVSSESGISFPIADNAVRNPIMKTSALVRKKLEVGTETIKKSESDLTGNESSRALVIQPDEAFVKDQDTSVAGFDLNEDLTTHTMDDYVRPDETLSSHSVICVVAKCGVPKGLPMYPLKFEGQMGWRGSAQTSAFHSFVPFNTMDRSKCLRISSPKNQKLFLGIDLNVAPAEVDYDTRQTKRLKIDLNSPYGTVDDPIQPDSSFLLDSNANPSTEDKSKYIPWLAPVQNHDSDAPNMGKQEFNMASGKCWVDLRTMQQQHVADNNVHEQQQYLLAGAPYVLQPIDLMQRAAPFQQTSSFHPNTLPQQSYLTNFPFHFDSSNIRPYGVIPYVGYPQEQGISPQLLYTGHVHHSVGTPSLFNAHSAGNNIAPSPPKADVKSDAKLAGNGSRKIEAGQSLYLGNNYSIVDQEAWYGSSVKKK